MEELMGLLNKSKKDMVSYLEEKNITYVYRRKNFIYNIKLLDEDFEVSARVLSNTISSIELRCTSVSSSYFNDFVKLLKEYMNNIYGVPTSDNTNHDTEYVEVNYHIDNGLVFLGGNKKYGVHVEIYSFVKQHSDDPFLVRWFIYFCGGFFWGLLMYLTNSNGYSWKNFGIYMIGGVAFTILFGVLFELLAVRGMKASDKKKYMHKYDSKFEEFERTIVFDKLYNGVELPKYNPARIYIKGTDVTITYYKRGLKSINTSLEMIDNKHLALRTIKVNNNDSFLVFLDDRATHYDLLGYIKDKLYDNEKFNDIYAKIDRAFMEYNPYSILNNGDEYKAYVYLFSREIYNSDVVTRDSIISMIDELFDDDMDEIMISEFTDVISKELDKK